MPKILDWPELNEMDRDELLGIITNIRENLVGCDDAGDFCGWLAEDLKVDCRT